jgi:hypothetical protein
MYLRNGRQALERADFLSALAFAKRAIEDHGEEIGACRLMGTSKMRWFPRALCNGGCG